LKADNRFFPVHTRHFNPPQNPAYTAYKIQSFWEILQFIAKMGGLIVYYLNKYEIKSIYSKDSTKARNLYFYQNVDWPGETRNKLVF
jgi:hypothetical protein